MADSKVWFITGCSKGFGRIWAAAALERGDKVAADGDLLERIRALPGAGKLPIYGVLDLHATLTPKMGALSDGLVAYRECPHTDSCEIAARAADQRQSDLPRQIDTPSGETRTRNQNRNAHPHRFDDHLGGQPSRGVENLVAGIDAVPKRMPWK